MEKCPQANNGRICGLCSDYEGSPYWNGSTCMPCYLAKVGSYWDGEQCVNSCPALVQNRVCTDCPENTPVFDKDSGKCR